jgi:manganese/iron transport system permease protein
MGMLSCGFMQRALLVGLLGGVACSVMGVLVIGMRLSFIGAVISHAAFAGGVIAMFAGYNPLVGAFVISLLAGAVIGPLCDKGEFNPDTSLGIVFAVMIGLAFLFMGLMPEAERLKAYSLIWGSILTVTNLDLKILMLTFALVLTLLLLFYKEIQAVIFNREIALAVGLPAKRGYGGCGGGDTTTLTPGTPAGKTSYFTGNSSFLRGYLHNRNCPGSLLDLCLLGNQRSYKRRYCCTFRP